MTLRTLSFVILAATLAIGSPAVAKEKDKPAKRAARTWMTVVDYVLANGTQRTLKAPLTRNLKFESDAITTKALRYKLADSPDKKYHAFYVIFKENEDGEPLPNGFVLGSAVVVRNDGVKSVEDFFLRVDLDGNIIAAVSSKGPSGKVIETIHPADSPKAIAALKAEKLLHLKTMDLQKLSK